MQFTTPNQTVAADIMVPRKKLVVLRPDMDALAAIRLLVKKQISGAPVVDEGGHYLGVFSEKTSMRFLLRLSYDSLPSNEVSSFMNTEPDRTIDEATSVLSIMELFLRTPYRRLPVVTDGVLVGQISRRDVLTSVTQSLQNDDKQRYQRETLYLSATDAVNARFA